ncbi:MAG: CPBP family intramembrane metalloprotease, partial [Planctomycetes bacterium]|nr:CPBP family intramembrane metalloprotease [Planctomycetota bacterium]
VTPELVLPVGLPPGELLPGAPRPWGPIATLAWGAVIGIAWFVVQMVQFVIFLMMQPARGASVPLEEWVRGFEHHGTMLTMTVLGANPVAIVICMLAVELRGWKIREYLGLGSVRRRDLAVGLASVVAYILVTEGLTLWLDRPIVSSFVEQAYLTAGSLPLLIFAMVGMAPLGEEIFFRGFLFRGLAESRLGPWFAVLFTSVSFAIIHLQYDWVGMVQVGIIGAVFAVLRWKTGSTTLTILLHAIVNLVATLEAVVKIEWLD